MKRFGLVICLIAFLSMTHVSVSQHVEPEIKPFGDKIDLVG